MYLRNWYAVLLAIWLAITFFVLLCWFSIGPLGPHRDGEPAGWITRFWPLIVWAGIPIVTAPVGLFKSRSKN